MKVPHILLVDDDRQLVKLMNRALTDGGYDVAATSSGKEVLTLIQQRMPDLLILDLNMPEPDGFDLLREVRTKYPYLRVLVISGFLRGALLDAARIVGAFATLEKPVSPDALVAKTREVLGA